jgi:hypothetical protein
MYYLIRAGSQAMGYQSKWLKQLVITTIAVVFVVACSVVFIVRYIAPPTTFYQAAEDGYLVILKWHLYSGVDINDNKGRDGETALHRAATRGKLEAAKFLIEKGADVNIERTYDGDTPLDLAADSGHSEIADLLREHGGKTSNELKADKKLYHILEKSHEYPLDAKHHSFVATRQSFFICMNPTTLASVT